MNPKSLIVIGSGPGGYVAALEAASRGIAVTLVERAEIGGTCLNRGCIPSKYLLAKAKRVQDALRLTDSGITMRLDRIEMRQLMGHKDELLSTLRQREEQALKAAKVRCIIGHAKFVSLTQLEVTGQAGTEKIEAEAILLATGSSISIPPLLPKHPTIVDSTSIFQLSYLPSHFVVIGGGYIGCEMACAFQGLGSKVTLIEKDNRLLPTQPEFEAAGTVLKRSFEKRGMTIWTGTVVDKVVPLDDKRTQLVCSNGETIEANAVLVAVGRTPNVKDLGLETVGITLENGRLKVNEQMQTNVPHIYAIGDLVSPVPLAHTASWEADVAVRAMVGEKETMNYGSVPKCIYTWPEAAVVGMTEEQARQAGFTPRIDRFHFAGNSKAMIEGESEGMWINLTDSKTKKILGAQIIGPHATELIHLVALGIKAGLTAEAVSNTVFAHPSLSESFRDVELRALAADKKTQAKP